MKVKVTASGVTIPIELLEGVTEVEIRKENHHIVVIPIGADDPIWDLGTNPITLGIEDAAENHDKYIYGASS